MRIHTLFARTTPFKDRLQEIVSRSKAGLVFKTLGLIGKRMLQATQRGQKMESQAGHVLARGPLLLRPA